MNSILENRNELMEKAVVTSVLNNISKKENVRGMKDLILYKYESDIRVTLVLQNMVRIAKTSTAWYIYLKDHQDL